MNAETWNLGQVAEFLGIARKSADKQLRRWGITPVDRQPVPGVAGMLQNIYDAEQVRAAKANSPGRGARTDLRGRDDR